MPSYRMGISTCIGNIGKYCIISDLYLFLITILLSVPWFTIWSKGKERCGLRICYVSKVCTVVIALLMEFFLPALNWNTCHRPITSWVPVHENWVIWRESGSTSEFFNMTCQPYDFQLCTLGNLLADDVHRTALASLHPFLPSWERRALRILRRIPLRPKETTKQ